MGERSDAFSSTSVGNYGFGHYDLNLLNHSYSPGDTANKLSETSSENTNINKPLQIDIRSDQLQAQTRKHISWWELCSAWWRVNLIFTKLTELACKAFFV